MLITITLLAFLVLLLVGLSSMTRVETQVTANSQSLVQARSNALLALNIAIGQLQKYTGPDQRVTARAEILDTNPLNRDSNGQPIIDGVPNPYWTGAWDSSQWNELTGVYGTLGIRGRQRPAPIAWLVSGNEGNATTYAPTSSITGGGASTFQVLYSGADSSGNSLGVSNTTAARVVAPTVQITASSVPGVGNATVGHYAYWVGDDGVMAKINSVAPEAVANTTITPTGTPASPEYYWKAMQPTRAGAEGMWTYNYGSSGNTTQAFPGFASVFSTTAANSTADRAQLRNIVASNQMSWLTDAGNTSLSTTANMQQLQAQMNLHAFDLTPYGAGVLSDTERGGLRLDLTRYLETGKTDGAFNATDCIYQDAVGIVTAGNATASYPAGSTYPGGRFPTFGLIKSWYDIGRNLSPAGFNATASALQPDTISSDRNSITAMGIYPVITSYQLAYTVVGSPGQPLYLLIQPMVTLWNPHNVTLPATDMVLEIHENVQMAVAVASFDGSTLPSNGAVPSSTGVTYLGTGTGSSIKPALYNILTTSDLGGAANSGAGGCVRVLLKGTAIAPGQSVGYSLDGVGGQAYSEPPSPATADPSGLPVMVPNLYAVPYYNEPGNFIQVQLTTLPLTALPAGQQIGYTLFRSVAGYPLGAGNANFKDNRFSARLYLKSQYGSNATSGPPTPLQDIESPSTTGDPGSMTLAFPSGITGAHVLLPSAISLVSSEDPSAFTFQTANMLLPYDRGGSYINGTTASQTAAIFAQFNVRGSYACLTDIESPVTGIGGDPFYPSGFYENLVSLTSGKRPAQMYWTKKTATPDLIQLGWTQNDNKQGYNCILFDYPRPETAVPGNGGYPVVMSLGELQHVDLSSYSFQPSFVFGNSWPDPRLARETVAGLWNGFPTPGSSPTKAAQADYTVNDYLLRDASYLANHALWDRFFLSTIPQNSGGDTNAFDSTVQLPNTRMKPVAGMMPGNSGYPTYADVRSVSKAADSLLLDGAFNINSTSVAAWRAFLGGLSSVPVPSAGTVVSPTAAATGTVDPTDASKGLPNNYSRFLLPLAQAFASNNSTAYKVSNQAGTQTTGAWQGSRYLTNADLDNLARNLVEEVKVRGPFMSIADFVNRRLITSANDMTTNSDASGSTITGTTSTTTISTNAFDQQLKVGALGAIQKAILNINPNATATVDLSQGLNAALNEPLMAATVLNVNGVNVSAFTGTGTSGWTQIAINANKGQLELLNGGLFAQFDFGAAGYLTQADVLQKIGNAISARSDTFTIRTYGDVQNPVTGAVTGKAWCEAVVQRLPEYVDPVDAPDAGGKTSSNPTALTSQLNQTFGRRYVVVSFRWLTAADL